MLQKQANYSQEKSERLEARLSKQQKELIQHAADLVGRSLTDFVLTASQEAAKKVTKEHQLISLTAQESKRFADAVLGKGKANAALKRAAKAHTHFLEGDD